MEEQNHPLHALDRGVIDRLLAAPADWQCREEWMAALGRHAEGHQTTLGPYHRSWH